MDAVFNIFETKNYGICVEGLESDNSEYLTEDQLIVSTRNYTYSQTVTVNVLYSLDSVGNARYEAMNINNHETEIDRTYFTDLHDGLYKIIHLIIPNENWIMYLERHSSESFDAYSKIYWYDTLGNKFKNYPQGIEVTIDDILNETSATSTIIRAEKGKFIIYHLNECFGILCKDLFLNLQKSCNENDNAIKQKIFNRDLFWMAINSIKYLVSFSRYYEAQQMLERVSKCGLLCDTKITYDCGCTN